MCTFDKRQNMLIKLLKFTMDDNDSGPWPEGAHTIDAQVQKMPTDSRHSFP